MGKLFDKLQESHFEFIAAQHIYFVATAPHEGRVHLAPKGHDTLRILGESEAAYLDLTGSGNEAAAHLKENGRLTIMLCGFEEEPLTLRLFGRGRVITPESAEWDDYFKHFEPLPGYRHIVVLQIESVQSSCGYSTPFYEYRGERDKLLKWANERGSEGLVEYRRKNNANSIDGLPTA